MLLSESSPRAFFARFAEIYGGTRDVFLMNPQWSADQRREAERLAAAFAARSRDGGSGRVFVASGGSGGKIRFVAHAPRTFEASARALIRALKLPAGTPLHCFACLPPWHVGGLMPFVRSRVSGGKLFVAESFGFHEGDALPKFRGGASEFWMNSLVPTQLRRLLARRDGAAWLRGFDFILLGGAAVPADLLDAAEREKLPLGVGYGMTETASLVALWRLGDAPPRLAGTPLPHAKIALNGADARIALAAESLGEMLLDDGALAPNPGGVFLTNDEGELLPDGRLLVRGRADRHVNSGGEKIDPLIVEDALRACGAAAAMVVGEPDAEWGARVVALVVPPFPDDLAARLRERLPAFMLPKRFVAVPALPLDAKGKLDRDALARALKIS